MPDSAAQADTRGSSLDAALARWAADHDLAPLFAATGNVLLVLDASAARVLCASEGAADLRGAIADADGRVLTGLRLGDQIRRGGPPTPSPRLSRLRFDPRGIARPTACLVARVKLHPDLAADEAVLLLAPTEPLPALRPVSASAPPDIAADRSAPSPDKSTDTAQQVPTSDPSGRFLWRSDADGVLTQVSGGDREIATRLAGRSWQALGESGSVAGASLLAALSERRTFRALPLTVRSPGPGDDIDLELSGSPSARPSQGFSGFSGFGVERGRRGTRPDAAARPETDRDGRPPRSRDEAVAPTVAADAAAAPMPAPIVEGAPHAHPVGAQFADTWKASGFYGAAATVAPPVTETAAAQDAAPARPADAPSSSTGPAPRGADLSTHEHAAFREIARALGARFAGDDESDAAPPAVGAPRGAVMAFPATAASNHRAAVDAAIVSALDRLPTGVLVHRDGGILFANRRLLALAGHPDRAAMQTAEGISALLRRRLSDDEPVSVTTGRGEVVRFVVERTDVDWEGAAADLLLIRPAAASEAKREQIAQALLQAREAARERGAQALLDHVEEGVAALDESGRILDLNRASAAMVSGDARELVGGTLGDLFAPESGPAATACLDEARAAGTSEPREVALRGRIGSGRLRLRVVRVSAIDTPRFCATLRDLPAPRQEEPARNAAAEPESAHRLNFIARVGHEIRTPLNGILGFADSLLAEQFGPLGSERYREYLRDIQASGERVLSVVDDLLDLARIEAGRVDLTFADLALNDLVANCIALMQPQAARDRIVVRTSLSPDLGPLVADERSMRQAALNVIANAIRFTEAGGQVIVSTTTAERGEIAFRVRDTGIGMTPEEIENALEPFRRVGVAVPRDGGGTGLGLTLTKALVEANRGRFRITSRKNEGTLVEMLFPPPEALSA